MLEQRRSVFLFLFSLFLLSVSSTWAAPCLTSGRACGGNSASYDSRCCAGMVCGSTACCTSGCRIGNTLYASGALNPSNPCQSCQPSASTTAWTSASNGASCNDRNACTSGDRCQAGACVGTPVSCDDHNLCTQDSCDPSRGCLHASGAAACDDHNPCTDDTCDATRGCSYRNNTKACSDGNACTVGDACAAGSCRPGTGTLACDDHNACTDDRCDPGSGCVHAPNTASCDDGNPCTTDSCDRYRGCQHTSCTASCDDGNPCTTGDKCSSGRCQPGTPRTCNDNNPCTDDSCSPSGGGCVYTPNTRSCDDRSACTTGDVCSGGTCRGTPKNCDDQNPCTDDSCSASSGQCAHANNTRECDDGNACTSGDRCSYGRCQSGPARSCDDNNPCSDDLCDPSGGCVYRAANGRPCEDGNPCTLGDVCNGLFCQAGPPKHCDDQNPCTDDSCDRSSGQCVRANNTNPCDDHDACTEGDTCGGGQCRSGSPVECDDQNPCTDDSCQSASGCVHEPTTHACDDHDACTEHDQCGGNGCVGSPVDCDDQNECTLDTCDPALGCLHTPRTGSRCDDGNACTGLDSCDGDRCEGLPLLCDDHSACTVDDCDPATGCIYTSVDCDDQNPCTGDICDPSSGCQHAPSTAPCDDGNACTTDDHCGFFSLCPSFGENFDGVTAPTLPAGWTSGVTGAGSAYATSTAFSHSAPNAAATDDPPDISDSVLDSPAIPIGSSAALLLFQNRYDLEESSPTIAFDGAVLEIKIGGGSFQDILAAGGSFLSGGYTHTIATGGFGSPLPGRAAWSGNSGGFVDTRVSLPPTASGQSIVLRFRRVADASVAQGGHWVDTIVIAEPCAVGCFGTAIDCDDHNSCTTDSCDPASGCQHETASDGVSCDDGDVCTTRDECSGGTCTGFDPVVCVGGDLCTFNFCDPMAGCTSAFLVCDDGNACTDDTCDPASGCVYTPDDTNSCSDDDACTDADACVGGSCTGGPRSVRGTGNGIVIPDSGVGTPYPSSLAIPSVSGRIASLEVTLQGLTHTFPADLDLLLVSPSGQNAIILSDAGGGSDVVNLTFTLSDAAGSTVPTPITPGTYRPTNVGTGDTFPPPAPLPAGGSALSVFSGTDPVGVWSLYLVDDAGGDVGTLQSWSLAILLDCGDGNPCTDDACDPTQGCTHDPVNGCAAAAACTAGADDYTHAAWVVCAAGASTAWVSGATSGGDYHPERICNSLGYASYGQIGVLCGDQCGFCETGSSCGAPGTAVFDGEGACGNDEHGDLLCGAVQWECRR